MVGFSQVQRQLPQILIAFDEDAECAELHLLVVHRCVSRTLEPRYDLAERTQKLD
jgi:hypothetical protein